MDPFKDHRGSRPPPREREGGQQILITYNGLGTLLKDRHHHTHFMDQERLQEVKLLAHSVRAVHGAGI